MDWIIGRDGVDQIGGIDQTGRGQLDGRGQSDSRGQLNKSSQLEERGQSMDGFSIGHDFPEKGKMISTCYWLSFHIHSSGWLMC